MRVGLVCPYSFDVPGGVQYHVRDLAEHLIGLGHEVSVLAPADDDTPLPPYLVSAGRAVPIRYNGSVARLNIGVVTSARVNRWLEEGDFDVVHLHEPVTPSVSILALWAAEAPIVATFHTSNLRSRAMQAAYPILRSSLERILCRIAVSEDARRTVTSHLGGDAVVIPNGVDTGYFIRAVADPRWQGSEGAPTVAFLGRIEEPRKGLGVLAAAWPGVLAAFPGARLLIAGPGDAEAVRAKLPPKVAAAATFLGPISDAEKASLLSSVCAYVAPHTGGESFGIVLAEAMAAGAPVVASNLPAFERVLGGTTGRIFASEDSADLARVLVEVLGDPSQRERLRQTGQRRALDFDWSTVAQDILAVYDTAIETADAAQIEATIRRPRLFRGGRP